MYNTRSRMSSKLVKLYSSADLALIERLLSAGMLDIEGGKLLQHRIVPYARRNEGVAWRPHPDLPGCVVIDEPFRPESWQGYSLED